MDCQFKSLERYPCSESHLNRLLNSLPLSLDETYERTLSNIDVDLIEDARRVLSLLCFAARPLTVRELIDGVAVEIGTSPRLNCQSRLQCANDLHEICPGLIEFSTIAFNPDETEDNQGLDKTVRIAHLSVQEYLESSRIRDSKTAKFALSRPIAHAEIAQVCLTYLCEPDLLRSMSSKTIIEDYPLARYSAQFWCDHYGNTPTPPTQVDELVLRLFKNQEFFETWVKIYDVDLDEPQLFVHIFVFDRPSDSIASPIYYASRLGLDKALCNLATPQSLQNTNRQPRSSGMSFSVPKSINVRGGFYGDALQAASVHGREKTVEIMVEAGADVNAQGGNCGSALDAASLEGHEKRVEILLNHGAEANASNALQAASCNGHEKIVKSLLEQGAEVNAQSRQYGNALYVASRTGYGTIVDILLAWGAEVIALGKLHGTALRAASSTKNEKIIQILLDNGAKIDDEGGWVIEASEAVSHVMRLKEKQTLLSKGATPEADDQED